MPAIQLLRHLRDPQSWVCLLAASTFIGLGIGAFEPADQARPAVVAAAEPVDTGAR